MRVFNEKKNEKAIVNMVMVVTTRNKALEEVAFQERESLKRKEPEDWQEEETFWKLMVEIV
jgi:hypothetical protein